MVSVVCYVACDGCCVLFVVWLFVVRCLLSVVCCLVFGVWWLVVGVGSVVCLLGCVLFCVSRVVLCAVVLWFVVSRLSCVV